ncbi:MAG: glycerol-3-phosphate 1-O-acyltransferase PlsY [Armatimonadota bacterium]|nr:glycerol-3-phosphate 1-O-acyltransferase PlsY [Armatimonadota bacterium]MDR7450342.1 glycerol-3-phosphate 1-O-acyltransferase PlsY [Armatimonadota bacterium]MDR7467075.1 glycerol-3-phosphate 1-O-acyltransferase PlsY [Armatimonadota bacterium]MDR7493383.1 glycerol-3-phosphate 1-O-acyltransferase PlsY [Armatimonadota bacterium]MDR7499391.1 glycerol-3-phosphate 1-O-acyltransferase PlsY [Armatimonadota bacterium]
MTIAAVIGAYLLGAVPTGLLLIRLLRGVDIRAYGSGNIGASNAFRLAGPSVAAAVLVLDTAKGVVPVLLARSWGLTPAAVVLVGLAAIAGHDWSPFLRFRGGKGVATSLGVLLVLSPAAAAVAVAVWAVVIAATQVASLASLLAAAAVPGVMWWRGEPGEHLGFALVALALVTFAHRANIGRLLRGVELRITDRRDEVTGPPERRA